jgi:hypothetical protein
MRRQSADAQTPATAFYDPHAYGRHKVIQTIFANAYDDTMKTRREYLSTRSNNAIGRFLQNKSHGYFIFLPEWTYFRMLNALAGSDAGSLIIQDSIHDTLSLPSNLKTFRCTPWRAEHEYQSSNLPLFGAFLNYADIARPNCWA